MHIKLLYRETKSMNEKTIISIIKTENNWVVQDNCLEKYDKKPGVWIMLGKKKGNKRFRCYEVGQTSDIMNEIITDAGAILLLNEKSFQKKNGRIGRWMKYSDLSRELVEIKFELVCFNEDRSEREHIEYIIAKKRRAVNWKPAPGQEKRLTDKGIALEA